MQASPHQQAILTRAAALSHQDRNAFILDAACREAEHVMMNQCLFQISEADFEALEHALAAPVPEDASLKALLQAPFPWEEDGIS